MPKLYTSTKALRQAKAEADFYSAVKYHFDLVNRNNINKSLSGSEQYREDHFVDFEEHENKFKLAMPVIQTSRMYDVIDFAETQILMGRKLEQKVNLLTTEQLNAYAKIVDSHIRPLLNSIIPAVDPIHQTTQEFADKVNETAIMYSRNFKNNADGGLRQMEAAWKNVLEKGELIEYDIENIGEDILEYSFSNLKVNAEIAAQVRYLSTSKNPEDRIKLKTLLNDNLKTTSAVMGLNDAQVKKYQELIKKWKTAGFDKSIGGLDKDKDGYIIQSLIKMGHENTSWHWDAKNGRAILDSFVSNDETKVLNPSQKNIDRLELGLKRYQEIQAKYDANLVDFSGKKVRGYEKDILEQLQYAKTKNKGITISGHGTTLHDNALIDILFSDKGAASNEAKSIFNDILPKGINDLIHFDSLVVARQLGNIDTNAAYSIAKAGEHANTATSLIFRFASFVKGAVQSFLEDNLATHSAKKDTISQALTKLGMFDMFTNMGKKEKEDFFHVFNKPYEQIFDKDREYAFNYNNKNEKNISVKIGDIFIPTSSAIDAEANMLSFRYDFFNEQFQFAGGVSVKNIKDGKAEPYSVYQGTKSGIAEMVIDIQTLKLNKEQRKLLGEISSKLGTNEDLVAVTFLQIDKNQNSRLSSSEKSTTFGNQDIFVRLMPKSALERRLSSSQYAGHVDYQEAGKTIEKHNYQGAFFEKSKLEQGRIIADAIAQAPRNLVDTKYVDFETINTFFKETTGESVKSFEDILELSSKVEQNDAASNWLRRFGYNQATGIVKLASELETIKPEDPKTYFNTKIYEDLITKKENSEFYKDFSYITYIPQPNGTIQKVNSLHYNTFDSVSHSFNFTYSLREICAKALEIVNKDSRYKNDVKARQAAFRVVFDAMMSSVALKVKDAKKLESWTPADVYYAISGRTRVKTLTKQQEDTFSIDISSLIEHKHYGRKTSIYDEPQNYLDIRLNDKPYKLIKSIQKKTGIDDPVQAIRELNILLAKQYKELSSLAEFSNRSTLPESEAEITINALKELRSIDKYAGRRDFYEIDVNKEHPLMQYFNDFNAEEKNEIFKAGERANKAIKFISPDKTTRSEKNIKDLAENYVNNYLFKDTKKFDNESAKDFLKQTYGFSDKTIAQELEKHQARKQEAIDLVTDIFQNILKNPNASLAINSRDGTLLFSDFEGTHIFDFKDRMIRETFNESSGVFELWQGNRKIVTSLIALNGSEANSMTLGSAIKEFHEELKKVFSWANAPRYSTGEKIDNIVGGISRAAANTVAKRTRTRFNETEAVLSHQVDISNIFNRLGYLYHEGVYEDIDLPEPLKETLENLSKQYDKKIAEKTKNEISLSDTIIEAKTQDLIQIEANLRTVLKPFTAEENKEKKNLAYDLLFGDNQQAIEKFQNIVSELNAALIKHPEKGYLQYGTDDLELFFAEHFDKRHIANVKENTRRLDFKLFESFSNEYKTELTKGSPFQSVSSEAKYQASQQPGNKILYDHERLHTAGIKKLTIEQANLEELLSSDIAEEVIGGIAEKYGFSKEVKKQFKSILHGYVEESAGIVAPELLALMPRNIQQTFRLDDFTDPLTLQELQKTSENVLERTEYKRLEQTRQVIKLAEDGVYKLVYGEEVWVNAGDIIASTQRFNKLKDDIVAKRSGLLSLRYYDKETKEVVSADDINDLLKSEEAKKRITSKKDLDRANEVHEILKEKYELKYSIRHDELRNSATKLLENTEKLEANAPMSYIGAFDKRIANVLKELGLEDQRLFTSYDIIEDKETFLKVLHGRNPKNRAIIKDTTDLEKLLNDALQHSGFHDYKEFKQAIYEERRLGFDTLLDILKKAGVPDKELKSVGVISNTLAQAAKNSHQEIAGLIQEYTARAIRYDHETSGRTFEESRKALFELLQKRNVFGKDQLSMSETDNLFYLKPDFTFDHENFLKTINEFTGNKDVFTKTLKIGDKTITINFGESLLSAIFDADMPDNNNKIKATRRMTMNMTQERWGIKPLLKMLDETAALEEIKLNEKNPNINNKNAAKEKALAYFADNFGDIATAQLKDGNFSITLNDGATQLSINHELIKNFNEEIFAGTHYNDRIQITAGSNIDNILESWKEKLSINGISLEDAKIHLTELSDKGYRDISLEKLVQYHSYATGVEANQINKDLKGASSIKQKAIVDKLITDEKSAFYDSLLKIEDLDKIETKLFQGSSSNTIGRAFVIDLGSDFKTKDGSRYIAVPFMNYYPERAARFVDTEFNPGELLRHVSSVAHQIKNLEMTGSDHQAGKLLKIQDDINKITDMVKLSVHSKTGSVADVTSGYLEGSGMAKASTIRTLSSSNPLLSQVQIDGLTLAKRTAAGKETNVIFMGKDFFEKALMTSDMQKILETAKIDNNSAIESMLKGLSEHGAIGVGARQPMEYMNSVASAYIVYDKNAHGTVKMTEALARAVHADFDGDTLYAQMLRAKATVNINGKTLNVRLSEEQVKFLKAIEEAGGLTQEQKNQFITKLDGLSDITAKEKDIVNNLLNDKTFKYDESLIASDKVNDIIKDIQKSRLSINISYDEDFFAKAKRTEAVISSGALSGFRQQILDEIDNNKSSIIDNITKREGAFRSISNNIYSYASLEKEADNLTKFYKEDIAKSAEFQQAIESYNKEYNKDIAADTLGSEDLYSYSKNLHSDSKDGKKPHIGVGERYLELMKDKIDFNAELADRALSFQAANLRIGEEIQSTLMRSEAGLANYSVFNKLKLGVALLENKGLTANGFAETDANIIGQVSTNILDAFQASKHNEINGWKTSDLNNAVKAFYGIDQRRNKQPLYDLITSLYNNEIKELGTAPIYAKDENGIISLERVLAAFDKIMPENTRLNTAIFDAFDTGFTQAAKDIIQISQHSEDILGDIQSSFKSYFENQKYDFSGFQKSDILIHEKAPSLQHAILDSERVEMLNFSNINTEESIMANIAEGAFKNISKVFSKSGAIGMLGFAGLAMTAGIVAGAPTSPPPATEQAQGISSENAIYELPSTISTGAFNNTANQGYIINVNASTSEGREFAENAINQAFAQNQATRNNNSITMNIKDSSSNISYSDIASYINNML